MKKYFTAIKNIISQFIISIRTSILTLFTTLMIIIGSIMILVHYETSKQILFRSAETMLAASGSSIQKDVIDFLKPAHLYMDMSVNLINSELIIPNSSAKFTNFLLANIANFPSYSGAYWGNPNGEFYIVERTHDDNFINETIEKNKKPFAKMINKHGNMINAVNSQNTNYNPTTRPWYIKATQAKSRVAIEPYLFYPWRENKEVMGLTIAEPIYDKKSKLRGVFGMDVKVDALANFIAKLRLSKNATVFIFDARIDKLIAATNLFNYANHELPHLTELKPLWAYSGYTEYQKHHKELFYYNYANERYLAYFSLLSPRTGNKVYLGIALPVNDIIGPLKDRLFISILFTISILILGMVLVGIASNSISQPVMELANETAFIKRLNLDFVSKVKSRIREIIYMQNAFQVMTKSLRSFARYVPLTIVKRLVETDEIARVGGENKLATFLFSDITGFTTVADKMEPSVLMQYLSEYLEAMTNVILEHKGTIDKYIGDAIMAFWGAPDDDNDQAIHACKCALSMFSALVQLNQMLQLQGFPEIRMRIGINTGDAVIGNVGSNERLNYTAIGDSVNVANRLEELNKNYGTKIIVSESTYNIAKDHFEFRLLEAASVRGKMDKINIYELVK